MAVREALDRIERVYRRMVDATLSDAPPDAAEILYLRQQFARACDEFIAALGSDKMDGHRALAARIEQSIGTLRIRLMTYTLHWQPALIESEGTAYRKAAQDMADTVWAVITTARSDLAGAGL